jgi:transposase
MGLQVERIDHLGIVAGIIQDLGLVAQIDQRIPPAKDEKITAGQAVAGMILSGLGFSDRPMSLTPQFFAQRPIGYLLGDETLEADYFNHFKLGRTLDEVYRYGCSLLFAELSLSACTQEGIDMRFGHLDTTSMSFYGEYSAGEVEITEESTAEVPVNVTYGYSRDHRPDLKQVLQELLVSQDGGVPMWTQTWSGNSNDSEIFRKRAEALSQAFAVGKGPKCLVADAKLYSEMTLEQLSLMPYVTRVPGTLKRAGEAIYTAQCETDNWHTFDAENYYKEIQEGDERWVIVFSEAAEERSQKSVNKKIQAEAVELEKQLKKLQRTLFSCEPDGKKAVEALFKQQKFHVLQAVEVEPESGFTKAGRPRKNAEQSAKGFRIRVSYSVDAEAQEDKELAGACYILATNTAAEDLSASDVIRAYKQQDKVERGFRFLKDPHFFTSALFLKKPERVESLLMVMVLALLVYSIAERRLRSILAAQQETLPNQIKQPTATPTLRWIFQLMDGISRVKMAFPGQPAQVAFDGLNELRTKVIRLLGPCVEKYYQNPQVEGCSM